MKKWIFAFITLIALTPHASALRFFRPRPKPPIAIPITKPAPVITDSLTFEDNFNGTSLDKTKWMTTYPWGSRNNGGTGETQYYADDAFTFGNGVLSIVGSKKAQGGYQYTSGMISSYGKFSQTYGRFEMRAKVPKGIGFWPAFWLLPVDLSWPPEIDVMEWVGPTPTTAFMTLHAPDGNGGDAGVGGTYTGPDFSADYHTYTVDWKPGSITWYIDGVQRFQVTKNVPSKPMYIIANLAIGGGWAQTPDKNTVFPGIFQLDYIKAWAYKP